jgi:hypothetical protein
MKKNILQAYALLICTITTVIMIISLSMMLLSMLEAIVPEYISHSKLIKYDSNERFKSHYSSLNPEYSSNYGKLKDKSDKEIEQMRINEREYEISSIKSDGLENIMKAALWLFVSFLFFFVHWRMNSKL